MLRVLVFGSGFAGHGHTLAFRHVGADVVGMVGRTNEVVRRVASRLSIPYASTDWRDALRTLRPDVVSIATPGGAHLNPILEALDLGCHVYCDKPLAATAVDAKRISDATEAAGVKSAYAASFCYEPSVLHAREIVSSGAIGRLLELEFCSHYDLNPLIPYGWSHSLAHGGGRLNNNFTHKLAIALRVSGADVRQVAGECRNDLHRVPAGPHVHDFREREEYAPEAEDAERWEWREVDSDWSYVVLARLRGGAPGPVSTESTPEDGQRASSGRGDAGSSGFSGRSGRRRREEDAPRPGARAPVVSATFRHGGLQPRIAPDYVAAFATDGAVWIDGAYGQGEVKLRRGRGEWRLVPTPESVLERTPDLEGAAERNWASLAREFLHDIEGQSFEPYLTFRDGWRFQEAIDAVRRGSGWFEVPTD